MGLVAFLLLLATAALSAVVWKQRRQIHQLIDRRKELVMEEHRMFAFLHGLSETLPQVSSQAGLYEFILKGVAKVVEAKSGALYLLDEGGKSLVPRAMLANLPPLFAVPEEIASDPSALHSHLMLRSVSVDATTVVGECMLEKRWTHQNNLWAHPLLACAAPENGQPLAGMIAPLCSGEERIGVLVLVGDATRFSANDFAVFRSLADQSSLALGMVLLSRQAAAKKQLDRELDNARSIQRILLPASAPEVGGYEIAGFNSPARIVSGDYYDYLPLRDGRLGVVVADVSGKGIPASLIMAMGRSVLRATAPAKQSPTEVLSEVNRMLYPDVRQDMFISIAYLLLSPTSDEIVLSRAGHDPPLLYRAATDAIEELRPPGLALGLDEGPVFDRVTKDATYQLQSGDVLLVYTDGLNEAMNAEGDEFGLPRVHQAFREAASQSAKNILDHLLKQAHAFVGSCPQSDDMTLVVIKKS